ncbi:PREDICTED: uncharacterized protein LOC109477740 [Branchiostoma belcheri]|uniref:Uncharacterized protein LOC109477740 n=1 Tax=Branchiostoma belcheri TaxID=7741 RepID=A0A6P4ZKY0_BRABE|nr:PREDICTED: uncharacterized protein LOC109477740 [Branchiostoma belcheri]
MQFLLFFSCVFLAAGGHGQNVLPNYQWPVYHQKYVQTGFCEYSFLLSVQNSDGVCLVPANVSTRLQDIERDRTLEKQRMKHLSSSLDDLSEQVQNLAWDVNNTSTGLAKVAGDQAEGKTRDEEMARDLANVTQAMETTRNEIELLVLQGEQRATILELTIQQQNQTIDELKTLVRQQSRDLDDLRTLVEQQSDSISQCESRLSHLEADTATTTTTGPAVAFSASRTTPLGPVTGHTRVIFDHVYVNIGNSYNPDDGIFTCNTAGAYMFTYFMYKAIEVPQMAVYLVVNNTIQTAIFENNSKMDEESHYSADMSGNSLILELAVGDTVSVVLRKNDYIYSNDYDKYCTFSGFLLK